MKEFYVTFGVKYHHENHPRYPKANPNGWVRILADDESQAREVANQHFGQDGWAFIYDTEPNPKHFPDGEIEVLTPDAVFRALPADQFPFTIEFIQASTGDVVHTIEVDGPGAVMVPGLGGKYGPITVRTTFPGGRVVLSD